MEVRIAHVRLRMFMSAVSPCSEWDIAFYRLLLRPRAILRLYPASVDAGPLRSPTYAESQV